MGKRYLASKKLKAQYLSEWLVENSEYRKKHKLSNILKVIGVCLLVIISVALSIGSGGLEAGIVVGLGLGVIVGCIPFIIGNSIGLKAAMEYGTPFSKQEKEYLLLSEERVEFGFSNVDNKYKESMDIYSIDLDKITAVNINGNILTIIGEGQLLSYDDITNKRLNHVNSQRKFYSNTPYSIMLDFDERDEIIESIKKMTK